MGRRTDLSYSYGVLQCSLKLYHAIASFCWVELKLCRVVSAIVQLYDIMTHSFDARLGSLACP